MSDAAKPKANRPVSPHLSVYRFPISAVLSILHRATGVALGAGTLLLTAWLVSAAMGPDAYRCVQGFIVSIFGQIVLLGFTVALSLHLLNGIRHLFWDAGYGFEVPTATRTGWLVVIGTAAITIIVWGAALLVKGG